MKKATALFITFIMMVMMCSCGLTVTETDNEKTEASVTTENTTEKTEVSEATSASEKSEKATEKSEQKTTEKSEEKTAETTQKKEKKTVKSITCTFSISCENILNNKDNLKENKVPFLPANGEIVKDISVTVPEGSTAFDVIKKACKENTCTDKCTYCRKNGIQLDYVYTPGYENYYIRGIHQIYEKDCGTQSGWMYCVNGIFPNYGCSQYKVKDGDNIRFLYTCDLGEDLGADATTQ